MYRELLERYQSRDWGDTIRPQPGASAEEVCRAEQELGVRFPQELRGLLMELNGDLDMLLSVGEIVEYSRAELSDRYPPGTLLYFGRDGSGGLFAYPVREGVAGPEIVFWDHETDSLDEVEVRDLLDIGEVSLKSVITGFYDQTCHG